jgi:hypothetical protein
MKIKTYTKKKKFSQVLIAQSFKHNQMQLGQQVCRPAQTRVTNLSA